MTAYQVSSAPVPAYAGTGLPAAEVARILRHLNPAALQEAGAAHTALGRELDTMAAQLTQESRTLAQHWSGGAARRALAQFQRLHRQTATLAAQATRTGSVLTWLGTQVVPAYRDPASGSQAQQYLTALSSALVRANGALPPEVGTLDPAQLASANPGPNTPASGPTSPTNPDGPASNASPATPATTSSPASSAPLASRLQSTPARPAPSEAPADPAPPAEATGAVELPVQVPLISGRTNSKQSSDPSKQSSDPHPVDQDSGLSGGAFPLQPAPAGPAAPTAAPASSSRGPLGALPMAGGVGRQYDHERQRDAWAPEDRNPWGLPDTCVPPRIEGA